MSIKIKEIKDKLANENEERVISQLNYDMAFEYVTFNPTLAYKHALIAYRISMDINDRVGIRYYEIYKIINEFNRLVKLQVHIKLFENLTFYESISDDKMIGLTLNYIGLYYFKTDQYNDAYHYYMKALERYKKIGNNAGILNVYRHIGLLLHGLKEYDEEIEYYKEALTIVDKRDKDGAYHKLLLEFGFASIYVNRLKQAGRIIEKLEDTRTNKNFESMKNRILTLKGCLEIFQGRWGNGLQYFYRSLEENSEDLKSTYLNYYYLGLYYSHNGSYIQAIKCLNVAHKQAVKGNSKNVELDTLEELVKVYKRLDDYEKAFELYLDYYQKEVNNLDTIRSITIQSIITNTKVDLLTKKNIELEWIANHDDLTGIYNRRYILNQFNDIKRDTTEVFLMIIDIDDFKGINDHFGHFTGDEIIKGVAKTLIEVIGEIGMVGRFGGDEFIVILRQITYSRFEKIVDELKARIKGIDLLEKNITISGGGVKIYNYQSLDDALAKADRVLYDVKLNGKNDIKLVL